jgi:hypothetical protein
MLINSKTFSRPTPVHLIIDAPGRNVKYIKITEIYFKQNIYNLNTCTNV